MLALVLGLLGPASVPPAPLPHEARRWRWGGFPVAGAIGYDLLIGTIIEYLLAVKERHNIYEFIYYNFSEIHSKAPLVPFLRRPWVHVMPTTWKFGDATEMWPWCVVEFERFAKEAKRRYCLGLGGGVVSEIFLEIRVLRIGTCKNLLEGL